jgi:TonB family protein
MSLTRVVLCLCFVLVSAGNVLAQLPDIGPLATRQAEAIAKAKRKSVVVLDFFGPGENVTELGETFSDAFSTALASSGHKFAIVARSRMRERLEQKRMIFANINNLDVALWMGRELKIDCMVFGRIFATGDRIDVDVVSFRVDSGKEIAHHKVAYSLSKQMQDLMNNTTDNLALPVIPTQYPPQKTGYSFPKCIRCPQAGFTDEAVNNRIQGTVVLSVVVTPDGTVKDIAVVKSLPYGLTQTAVETVMNWRLAPASTPEGTAVAVRQTIEVTFHLYSTP